MCINCVNEGINFNLWKMAHESPKGLALAKTKSLKDRLQAMEALNEEAAASGRPPLVTAETIALVKEQLYALARVV